jgi:ATP-binding cassette subfamily F protein 3
VLRKASSLSGGERARVALALLELEGANLLVFDEPTNHLDVEAIEALEEAIEEFDGTVVLVSHDRALLRALARRVWVLHDGRITDYPGTFSEWETASREQEHAARVKAAEEEKLRLLHEKQKLKRQEVTRSDEKEKQKEQQRKIREAEERVAKAEKAVADIQAQLAETDLYTTPEGVKKSVALGKELDAAKKQLDAAYSAWEALTQ